jgi:hypothetical protein
VDQQEDEAYDQPDYRQGVEHALEDSSHFSVLTSRSVILSAASANALAESKDPLHLSIMHRRDRVFFALDSTLLSAAGKIFDVMAAMLTPQGSFDSARRLASLAAVLRSG